MCVWGCLCSSHWFAACRLHPDPHPESAGDAVNSRSPQPPRRSTKSPRSAPSSTWQSSKVARTRTKGLLFSKWMHMFRLPVSWFVVLICLGSVSQDRKTTDRNLLLTSPNRAVTSRTSASNIRGLLAGRVAQARWCVIILPSTLDSSGTWPSQIYSDPHGNPQLFRLERLFLLVLGRKGPSAHTLLDI